MRVADARLGSWSQRKARERHLQFLRARQGGLGALAALAVAGAAIVTLSSSSRLAAFVAGAVAVSVPWYVAVLVIQHAGTATKLLGNAGESLTADVLHRLGGRRWHAVNTVPFEFEDVDHVLVGRCGVMAIETKAISGGWDVDQLDQALLTAIRQARHGATRIRNLLLEHDTRVRTSVQPVLVVWGELHGASQSVDGVAVLHGSELSDWIDGQTGVALSEDEVRRATEGIERFVAMRENFIRGQCRDQHGRLTALIELGPGVLLGQLGRGLAGSAVALVVLAGLMQVLPEAAVLPVIVASIAAGAVGFKISRVRLPALGWLSLAGGIVALSAGLSAWTWLVQ